MQLSEAIKLLNAKLNSENWQYWRQAENTTQFSICLETILKSFKWQDMTKKPKKSGEYIVKYGKNTTTLKTSQWTNNHEENPTNPPYPLGKWKELPHIS